MSSSATNQSAADDVRVKYGSEANPRAASMTANIRPPPMVPGVPQMVARSYHTKPAWPMTTQNSSADIAVLRIVSSDGSAGACSICSALNTSTSFGTRGTRATGNVDFSGVCLPESAAISSGVTAEFTDQSSAGNFRRAKRYSVSGFRPVRSAYCSNVSKCSIPILSVRRIFPVRLPWDKCSAVFATLANNYTKKIATLANFFSVGIPLRA